MSPASAPRVVVAGGSLAGLLAGLLLRDAGWEVDVFERSPRPLHGFGAGVVMHDATSRWFVDRTDISIDDLSIPCERLQYVRPDGTLEYEEPVRWDLTSWNALYRGLLHCFGRERYHQGEALVGFSDDGERVGARFASGRHQESDLLVCADGVLSTGRKRLFPDVAPAYSGYVGWRGIVSRDELDTDVWELLDGAFTYGLMPDSHVVAYPIPTTADDDIGVAGRQLNFTWYRNVCRGPEFDELMTDRHGMPRTVSMHGEGMQDRFVNEMRAAAEETLAPALAQLVTRAREPFVTAIVDAESPDLQVRRVCLVGDAGFTARPHAAAGAAKGAETAWTLARALVDAGGDVPSALAAWAPPMISLGRALVERTRNMGARLQGGGPWDPADRSLRFGLYGAGR